MEPAGGHPHQPTRGKRQHASPRGQVPVQGIRTYQGAPTFFSDVDEIIFNHDEDFSAKLLDGNTEFDRMFIGCAGLSSKRQPEDELDELFITDQRSRGTKMFHDAYTRTLQQLIGDQPMDCTLKFSEEHMKNYEGMAGLSLQRKQHERVTAKKRMFPERSASAPSVQMRPDCRRQYPHADQGLRVDRAVFGGACEAACADWRCEDDFMDGSEVTPAPEGKRRFPDKGGRSLPPPPQFVERWDQCRRSSEPTPLPVLFVSHGSGAMPLTWSEDHPVVREFASMAPSCGLLNGAVQAVLVISAHWETDSVQVTFHNSVHPQKLFYDYKGFSHDMLRLKYRPMGCPELSNRVVDLLRSQGIPADRNNARRLDHGVFVPLILMKGLEKLPVVAVSIPELSRQGDNWEDNARTARRLGRALAPLRSEGVLILGSGQATHTQRTREEAERFVETLKDVCTQPDLSRRAEDLENWRRVMPCAREVHMREDHLMPLLIAAGAAEDERGEVMGEFWQGSMAITHFRFGAGAAPVHASEPAQTHRRRSNTSRRGSRSETRRVTR